jgi:hypothetical protein
MCLQLVDLDRADPGNETEVIVIPPTLVAGLPPPADIAMLFRIWIVCGRRLLQQRCFKSFLYAPEVRRVAGKAVVKGLEVRPGRDDVHVFRGAFLCMGQQIRIDAELQDCTGFGLARQLGIDRLIRPIAKPALPLDPPQNIGSPAPLPVRQSSLHDHRHAALHRRNPDTGKRIARPRQQGDHIAVEVPSLRIVDQAVWDAVQARLNAIRASPGPTKQRQSEFWKQRRPKHLLTGLLHCGACGGALAAIGKDYLACTAARSGAGCSNRSSVRRSRVEGVVLEGLKGQLMAPELVEEFIRAFHEEVNRQSSAQEMHAVEHQAELARVTKKLKGLYDAIADGLRTPGLKDQLLELEARQTQLKDQLARRPHPSRVCTQSLRRSIERR